MPYTSIDGEGKRQCGWEYHSDLEVFSTGCGEEIPLEWDRVIDGGWEFCPHCGSEIVFEEAP